MRVWLHSHTRRILGPASACWLEACASQYDHSYHRNLQPKSPVLASYVCALTLKMTFSTQKLVGRREPKLQTQWDVLAQAKEQVELPVMLSLPSVCSSSGCMCR